MSLFRNAAGVVMAASLFAQQPSKVDMKAMRNNMFAALALDFDAMQYGMKLVEQALAENPNNAEAIVWKGVSEFTQAGAAFLFEKNTEKGNQFLKSGLEDLGGAVKLEPDNIYVRIPRGIVLMNTTRTMEPTNFFFKAFTENARSDFQKAFDLQKDRLDTLSTHQLGELLQGLGDLNSVQGKTAEAEQFYRLIQQKLPGTEYARRADEWMASKKPLRAERVQCIGCHTNP